MKRMEEPSNRVDELRLLNQLENLLDSDILIDEVGFVHPVQLLALYENLGGPLSPSAMMQSEDGISYPEYDQTVFWNRNHKLAIVITVLPQLYNAAVSVFNDASRKYKRLINPFKMDRFDDTYVATGSAESDHFLEMEVMRHSRALLILCCDSGSAWNSRKLVLSRSQNHVLLMAELQLSALILSYSPKSEFAWSHRRWVVKMVAGKQNMQEIIHNESELVKRISEKSKMNYRAWNHRCWVVSYIPRDQVLHELSQSRKWAELHVADSSCFHYRRSSMQRLMLRFLQGDSSTHETEACINYKSDINVMWKEELEWNWLLIERYVGREALWVHRRFLAQYWLEHFAANHLENQSGVQYGYHKPQELVVFLGKELQLIHSCLNMREDELGDSQSQSEHAASYLLWISKQIRASELQGKLREMGDLRALLEKLCPHKKLLWEGLVG